MSLILLFAAGACAGRSENESLSCRINRQENTKENMSAMRAKMQVQKITTPYAGAECLELTAVCGNAAFGANGESEDNTFARYTPSGALTLTINNPDLIGKFQVGQKFYLDFIEAAE